MSYKDPNYMKKFRQRDKRTHSGWLTKVYGCMRKSAKRRKMAEPNFTKRELWEWISKDMFKKLFDDWVVSGCKKSLVPSINRLNDYKSYTLENIELVTWGENNRKGRGSVKTKELVHSKLGGIAKKLFSKPVIKSDLSGKILAIYPSVREAARQNNTDSGSIAHVCRGDLHSHHNFKWSYENN